MKGQPVLKLIVTLLVLCCGSWAYGQGMAVNTTGSAADTSAILDVASTTKGFLAPRMSTTQRMAINNPAKGLLVFDSTLGSYYFNSGTSATPAWTVAGGTAAGTSAGQMLYWNGTAWVGTSAGTNGQILKLISGVPTWTTPSYYTITATSPYVSTGSISPAGINVVSGGSTPTYTITPAAGYAVSSVTVDGVSVGAVTTYTFPAVSANHTINVTFVSTLAVGQSYQGGIIGYILTSSDPGYDPNQVHGIIAATSDQSSSAPWFGSSCLSGFGGSTGTILGVGYSNTNTITSACSATGTAAQICHAYNGGGYSDWYLPSLNELAKLQANRVAIGGFSTTNGGYYWSSSNFDGYNAYYMTIGTGFFGNFSYATTIKVRAIRSF